MAIDAYAVADWARKTSEDYLALTQAAQTVLKLSEHAEMHDALKQALSEAVDKYGHPLTKEE